ncbi:hypothetical protein HYZ41_02585 [archaeon]|nr:hypothetical protein [archaeon]
MNKNSIPMILTVVMIFGFVALSNYNYGYGWHGYGGSTFNLMTVPSYPTIVSYPSYSNVYVSGGISPIFLASRPSYTGFYYNGFSNTRFYNPQMYFNYIDP